MARLTQEELLEIFNALKKEMKPYEKAPIQATIDIEGRYNLVSAKEGMVAGGKPRPQLDFVTIIIQSNYVGFYYMPIYCGDTTIRPQLSDAFLKMLKGKACFHIKAVNEEILSDVRKALEVGYKGYTKMGWL